MKTTRRGHLGSLLALAGLGTVARGETIKPLSSPGPDPGFWNFLEFLKGRSYIKKDLTVARAEDLAEPLAPIAFRQPQPNDEGLCDCCGQAWHNTVTRFEGDGGVKGEQYSHTCLPLKVEGDALIACSCGFSGGRDDFIDGRSYSIFGTDDVDCPVCGTTIFEVA